MELKIFIHISFSCSSNSSSSYNFYYWKKNTGCINHATKGVGKAPRNPSSSFFTSYFTVSVTPSINTPESSNDFMILIISFISSFEINKLNRLPTLTAPLPLIFLLNLFVAFKVKLLTNPGKLSLAKAIAMFVSAF